MTAQIIPFSPRQRAECAWQEFQTHAARLYENNRLWDDMDYRAEWNRLHSRYLAIVQREACRA